MTKNQFSDLYNVVVGHLFIEHVLLLHLCVGFSFCFHDICFQPLIQDCFLILSRNRPKHANLHAVFFFSWDSLHEMLKCHYKAWS